MARASSQVAWITSKAHGKTELNANKLAATLFSKLREILQQAINSTRGMDGQSMTCITKHPQ